MATWIPNLTSSTEEAVGIAIQRPARLPEHSSFLHQLDADKIQRAPEAFARLVAHLLKGTTQPFHSCHSLKQVVADFKAQVPTVDVRPIVEQALRLGCSDAPQLVTSTSAGCQGRC